MNSKQKIEIQDAVIYLVQNDYLNDFETIYQLAVQYLKDYVPQASEEVRNFLDHVARALVSASVDDAELEIARAKKHIQYARYLCLLAIFIHERKIIEVRTRTLEAWSFRAIPELRKRLKQISAEKRKIRTYKFLRRESLAEIISDVETLLDVNHKYERLLKTIEEFQSFLDLNYYEPGLKLIALRTSVRQVFHWVLENLIWVVLIGLAIHIVGTFIYENVLQNYLEEFYHHHLEQYIREYFPNALPAAPIEQPLEQIVGPG